MKKLTKQEAIENHRKMWSWISDEILKKRKVVTKKDYFDEHNIPLIEQPMNDCYCCEYALSILKMRVNCDLCPIKWTEDSCNELDELFCCSDSSPYLEYRNLCYGHKIEKLAKYAKKISELPINGGLEEN